MFIKWEQASAAFCVTACRNPIISPADNLRAFRKIRRRYVYRLTGYADVQQLAFRAEAADVNHGC